MGSFRRKLRNAISLTLFVVWVPFFLLFVELPVSLWKLYRDCRPANLRAVLLAVEAHNFRSPRPADSAFVLTTNRERCFVLVAHPNWSEDAGGDRVVFTLDPVHTVYAVWYADGRVVEVVTRTFAWGIRPEPFVIGFEAELAANTQEAGPT